MKEDILFVDDEEFILNLAERIFNDRGIEILTTSRPTEALNLVKNHEIAVLVSDNMMPQMTGIELLSRVKVLSPDTVNILMTGYASLQTAIDAINKAEAFRFVVKPWDNFALIEMVEDALQRYRLKKSIRLGDESTMLSLIHALELKDPYTKGHSERVAEYALAIAKAVAIPEERMTAIKYGSWLHDCGKIGISETILHGEGPLDEAEMHIIKNHPLWGADVVKDARLSDTTVNIILSHHERYDGQGYPFGIKGSSTRALTFENCGIPKDRLLGEVGKGHRIAFGILAIGRFKLGAGCNGIAKEVLKYTLKYTGERQQFGKSINTFGLIRKYLADMGVRIFVAESMNFRTLGYINDGMHAASWDQPDAAKQKMEIMDEFQMEASIMKVWDSEALGFIADDAVQCFGGYGFSAEYPPEKIYRDNRINRLFEGTNEINRM
ncbi:MAG TPA: acyl-CoA dehydrogenase family protein, partial [Deltaproteobacteria bacterium]|nr:acyl-CoA dehydrogenase family protein [Deltaproteobacteria bacterium]